VQAFFAGRELGFTLNADEAVACGAALASERGGGEAGGGGDLIECVLATVGIAGDGGHFEPLLRAGQATPARQCAFITTTEDAQSDVFVRVYEGDRNACSVRRESGLATHLSQHSSCTRRRKMPSCLLRSCLASRGGRGDSESLSGSR